jgi:uncharacterized membrane protein YeaQ/YmgE (transglycosylase-associated protein family)
VNRMKLIKNLSFRQRAIGLIGLEIGLILLHVLLRKDVDLDSAEGFFEWHYILPIIVGALIVAYLYSIRCPNKSCRARQVLRGPSIFDLRMPADSCYKCNTKLKGS